jgi:hypothetical protein
MGLWKGGHYYWGGSIENKTDKATGPVIVAIVPIDERCRVGVVSTSLVSSLAANEKKKLYVPLIVKNFHHYRVLLQAYDAQGFRLKTADLHQEVLDSRIEEERKFCASQGK